MCYIDAKEGKIVADTPLELNYLERKRRMTEPQPYSKVTIIVESGDETTKYTIPKARKVNVETTAIEDDLGGYLTHTGDLKLKLTADFDEERQHILLIEKSSIGRPVEEKSDG